MGKLQPKPSCSQTNSQKCYIKNWTHIQKFSNNRTMKLSIFFLVAAVVVLLLALITVSEGTRSSSSSSTSRVRYCKRLSYFKNGRFYFSRALARRTHYKIGSVLEMRCNTGYKLIGSKYLRCAHGSRGNVGWLGRLAICKPSKCTCYTNSRHNIEDWVLFMYCTVVWSPAIVH